MTEIGLSPLRHEGSIIEGATFLVSALNVRLGISALLMGLQNY